MEAREERTLSSQGIPDEDRKDGSGADASLSDRGQGQGYASVQGNPLVQQFQQAAEEEQGAEEEDDALCNENGVYIPRADLDALDNAVNQYDVALEEDVQRRAGPRDERGEDGMTRIAIGAAAIQSAIQGSEFLKAKMIQRCIIDPSSGKSLDQILAAMAEGQQCHNQIAEWFRGAIQSFK